MVFDFMKKSLSGKLIVAGVFFLMLMVASINIVMNSMLEAKLKKLIADDQKAKINTFIYIVRGVENRQIRIDEQGRMFAGDINLEEDTFFVDKISELTGGVATIFKKDKRISTSIRDNGERAVGTPLGKGDVYNAVFRNKESYLGEARILGKKFYTIYQPISDLKGEVIGIFFVGYPLDFVLEPVEKIYVYSIAALVFSLGVFFLLRKQLKALKAADEYAKKIIAGNLDAEIDYRGEDEIGSLVKAIRQLIARFHGTRIFR